MLSGLGNIGVGFHILSTSSSSVLANKEPWRHSGLMISTLAPRLSGLGSGPDRGHCVVFLGKTLYSHSASLHPGV